MGVVGGCGGSVVVMGQYGCDGSVWVWWVSMGVVGQYGCNVSVGVMGQCGCGRSVWVWWVSVGVMG